MARELAVLRVSRVTAMTVERWAPDEQLVAAVLASPMTRRMSDLAAPDRSWLVARPKVGDAVARSSALLQALEVGTCVLAGYFPRFEEAAVAWQSGQHQPDGLAALVVAHDVVVHSGGREWSFASPPAGSIDGGGSRLGGSPHAMPWGGVGSVTSMDDWMRRRVG